MKLMVAVLLVSLGLAPAAIADNHPSPAVTVEDRIVIERVIREQLAAFKADDDTSAFAQASPGIQRKFGTPEAFMLMVRRNYQAVYRPLSVSFGELAVGTLGPIQPVSIVGPNAVAFTALYLMERQADGTWKIGGCFVIPSEDRTA